MDSFSPLALKKLDRAAASRQKSCNACVRGKRKCDKRTPRCTRCAAKGLECVYAKTPPGSDHARHHDHGGPVMNEVADFDMGFDIETLGTNTTPSSLATDVHLLDSSLDFNIMDLMSNGYSNSELWNLTDYGNKMNIPPVPMIPEQQIAIRDSSFLKGPDDCGQFDPLDVHDPRTRVGYVVNYLIHLHRDFVQARTLPFIHPRLYASTLPKTLLSAFSASAAYASRTPQNKAWIMKLVADTARDIHREGERAVTTLEKMARVQAMVVIDTIRLFDGDITLRVTAEREFGQLAKWTEDLRVLRDELHEGLPAASLMTREKPPKSWESWLLLESMRRTVVMSFSFLCLSTCLRGLEPAPNLFPPCLAFTASRHLWEADSPAKFYRAWQEKPQFCVKHMQFKEFWAYARPDDLDDFTKLMLTSQAGPDALDYFLFGNPIPAP